MDDSDVPPNDDGSVKVDLSFDFPYFDAVERVLYVRKCDARSA